MGTEQLQLRQMCYFSSYVTVRCDNKQRPRIQCMLSVNPTWTRRRSVASFVSMPRVSRAAATRMHKMARTLESVNHAKKNALRLDAED